MVDTHTKEARSYNMSRIRSKDTTPEKIVRKYLHVEGFRFRIHNKKLDGKPDVVLKKYNSVIFVNGCFWHGHKNCKYFVIPKTRVRYWTSKIDNNIKRDREKMKALKKKGWNVFVVWECQLKKDKLEKTLKKLKKNIKSNNL